MGENLSKVYQDFQNEIAVLKGQCRKYKERYEKGTQVRRALQFTIH